MPDSGSPFDARAAPAEARAAGLRYVSDQAPGIRRQRAARGFRYVDAQGRLVRERAELRRIAALAVPPAYTDVWICPDPVGHLQATGRDARGRKQYRYHAHWRALRDDGKFGRMQAFGRKLPALRRRLKRDLALPGLPRDKVLATVVSLLDRTRIRVGNEEYARANGSFGLTTLRDRHVAFLPAGRAVFRFRGKSGQWQEAAVDDAQLTRIVRHCQQLPGQQLFQYVDDAGARQPVDSGMVNDYLRAIMGGAFTAKDFRTWGATLSALARMGATPLPERRTAKALRACVNAAVCAVAAELGNTPAVCRKSYIHPGVFEAWQRGTLPPAPAEVKPGRSQHQAERATLRFLRAYERARTDLVPALRASLRASRRRSRTKSR